MTEDDSYPPTDMGNKSFKARLASEGQPRCPAAASMSSFFVEESTWKVELPSEVASIGQVLGRGSDAVVFEAVEKESGAVVAVKVVHLPVGKDCRTKFRRMNLDAAIEREREALKVLCHSNIVKLYGVHELQDSAVLVLELARGPSLARKLIEMGSLDEASTRAVISGLVSAVKHMHDHDIVHRDLKPENIMFKTESDFDVLLIDFGYATTCKGDNLGETLGTPNYLAPEICKYLPYGKGVDVWALGVLLFISLFGRFPFDHCCQNELFKLISKGVYTLDDSDYVGPMAKSLIQKMIVVDRKERYTIDQVASHPWFADTDALVSDAIAGSSETSCSSSPPIVIM